MIYVSGYHPEILVARLDGDALVARAAVPCPDDPSYLAVAPDGRTLYAAHELERGQVSAFAVAEGGDLRLLGTWQSGGALPCHLSVHPSGRYVLCAHWSSGTVSVLPVNPDGTLGPDTDVVEHPRPHAHMVVTDPSGQWVLTVNLSTDTIYTYRLDLDSGRLRPAAEAVVNEGGGARHLAFHPDGRRLYLVSEVANALTECSYDAVTGRVEPVRTVPLLPDGVPESHASAVQVGADGRHVYAANRGHDTVAVLATEPELRLVGTYPCGPFPRDITLLAGGTVLGVANQNGDHVTTMTVAPDGTPTGTGAGVEYPAASCILEI